MAEYIDREALYRDFLEYCDQLAGIRDDIVEAEMFGVVQCLERVESAPAADVVEVRHGEWERAINQKHSAKWSSKVACSVCRCQGYERYHYCPYCGAKMDGKGEGE